MKKIQSSSVSCGGGKKRLDAGAGTGDGVPAEVEEEETGDFSEHFNSNNKDGSMVMVSDEE